MAKSMDYDEQYGPLRLSKSLMENIRLEAKSRGLPMADVIRERLSFAWWYKEVGDGGDTAGAEG